MSAERQITIIQRQMDEIMEGIKEAKNARAERYTRNCRNDPEIGHEERSDRAERAG